MDQTNNENADYWSERVSPHQRFSVHVESRSIAMNFGSNVLWIFSFPSFPIMLLDFWGDCPIFGKQGLLGGSTIRLELLLGDPVPGERGVVEYFPGIGENGDLISGLEFQQDQIRASAWTGADHRLPAVGVVQFLFQRELQVGTAVTGEAELVQPRTVGGEKPGLRDVAYAFVDQRLGKDYSGELSNRIIRLFIRFIT